MDYNQNYDQNANFNNGNIQPPYIPDEYRPITMWGYFGYELLFSIPCIGFILLLVFAFGGTKNYNLRNFARSYFCFLIVLLVILLLFGGTLVGIMANYM